MFIEFCYSLLGTEWRGFRHIIHPLYSILSCYFNISSHKVGVTYKITKFSTDSMTFFFFFFNMRLKEIMKSWMVKALLTKSFFRKSYHWLLHHQLASHTRSVHVISSCALNQTPKLNPDSSYRFHVHTLPPKYKKSSLSKEKAI